MKRIDQQHAMAMLDSIPSSNYQNCGRKRKLTRDQEKAVVAFVKRWRSKRFCTCNYIRAQLKLKVHRKTIGNTLNRYGYYWNAVPKVRGLSGEELQKREVAASRSLPAGAVPLSMRVFFIYLQNS